MSYDLLCFSHLRWNFVYQRPQHLLSRFAQYHRVFIIEEPVFDAPSGFYEIYQDPASNVWVMTPHLPHELKPGDTIDGCRSLLDLLIESMDIRDPLLWYYSPMALSYSDHLRTKLVVYDCMDELSAFKFAPPELRQQESQLLQKADIVFTGGYHLFEAKRHLHSNIHAFPSSIDKEHFARARTKVQDPEDQVSIPYPRIGFYGVIDERFDIPLLTAVAEAHPEWHFIVLGPVAKIDPADLPRRDNIHFPGGKDYKELPQYLAGWDVAMMPFALNDSTKYISPTKTPEFLAGGKPVVSTPIHDVITPYGEQGLVMIAETPEEFAAAIAESLSGRNDHDWLDKVDAFLANQSWDKTFRQMNDLIEKTIEKKITITDKKEETYV